MAKIKNIIFDLGGIFININYEATRHAFVAKGIANFNDYYNQHSANSLFEDLETGKVSAEEFYKRFRKETGTALTDDEIGDAWNAMLGSFPAKHLNWLEEIGFRYKIYLYSNTNIIHYAAFQNIYKESTGRANFDDYFIKAHYSHDLGVRKPYPESFKKLLAIEDLDPSETLFIDDSYKNIEGAKAVGMQTILLLPPKTVLDLRL
ncbi:MAG: HAD family phosphatase [Bacteroidota bacterium]|nr:HAD family phosphatase [Bacteroidota bacterium]